VNYSLGRPVENLAYNPRFLVDNLVDNFSLYVYNHFLSCYPQIIIRSPSIFPIVINTSSG